MKAIGSQIINVLNLSWLTGPIFDKELRVASRRKRNYLLRVLYILTLMLLIVLIWAVEVRYGGSNAYGASRFSQVGLIITAFVVSLQFYVAQFLAIIMLSNSISDEVYNKTLGILMSTPITSLQVVMGKLLSKLLQIILLIAVTLPILAIIRVFGGIRWNFLIASMCLTMTAVIFAGMLSLNISIRQKHTYAVIVRTMSILFFLYILLPLLGAWLVAEHFNLVNSNKVFQFLFIVDPLVTMHMMLQELFNPRFVPVSAYMWYWNCAVMLAASALLFLRAVIIVRKTALLQVCGQLEADGSKFFKKWEKTSKTQDRIKHVRGEPIIWKEIRKPLFKGGLLRNLLLFLLIAAGLGYMYWTFYKEDFIDDGDTHILLSIIFTIIGVFFTAVNAGTTITSEKHSRSWPLLLGTLVTDRQILFGKVIGVLYRSLPAWIMLAGHVLIFTVFEYIHPASLLHLPLIFISLTVFVISSGILFSSLFKHTTTAVIMNLIFTGTVFMGILMFIAVLCEFFNLGVNVAKVFVLVNPFFQTGVVMDATAGPSNAALQLSRLRYDWELWRDLTFIQSTIMLMTITCGYLLISLAMLGIAKLNLRKRIY